MAINVMVIEGLVGPYSFKFGADLFLFGTIAKQYWDFAPRRPNIQMPNKLVTLPTTANQTKTKPLVISYQPTKHSLLSPQRSV
jgi:hypothetical protein